MRFHTQPTPELGLVIDPTAPAFAEKTRRYFRSTQEETQRELTTGVSIAFLPDGWVTLSLESARRASARLHLHHRRAAMALSFTAAGRAYGSRS